ncbi:BPI LBP family protein [Musa troglodytarum]|uniref:BPI LBP family protein n=1 Tax=Musa troglodytarum TaxID=320322 RepID=A0A9E7HLI9_9LILI|nr:BPI LBP family protein [Musa troglodytarum]
MAPPLLFRLLLPLFFLSVSSGSSSTLGLQSGDGYISAVVSEKGLAFAKDLLVERAVETLTSLRIRDIEKSVGIPIVGVVRMVASNITLEAIHVSSSTVQPGESGIVIVASGTTANLTMDWFYSYTTWFVPFEISDKGGAFIQKYITSFLIFELMSSFVDCLPLKVEGMEVGLTMTMENKNGTLELSVTQCGCYMENFVITLNGGASWFYQGFVNAFADQIRSAVEDAIVKKINEGALKLDSLLKSVPNKIDVDKVSALNVTFVNDPTFTNSSVEFDINGLFVSLDKASAHGSLQKTSQLSHSCDGAQKMLWMSLDESVFNSASDVYFQAGVMHWIVEKIPDQSFLNTAKWKYLIPQLYKKYPNDDMLLNMSLTSPPGIWITAQKIGATISLDMTIDVLDGSKTIPVACISVVVSVSGVVEISGNNLAGQVELDDFTLTLKWSDVGNFHMYLIQGVMRVFLNTVFVPYVNTHLRRGFPLPIVHGFTLQHADILTANSIMIVCSDVAFNKTTGAISSL